jgi:nucleotide-binding universal stress UspA family protein
VHIKTILVPTDFSENAQAAFATACDFAQQLEAKIYLLHIQEESSLRVALKEGLLESTASDEEISSAVEKLIEGRFSSQMSAINVSQVQIEHLVRRGDADAEIIKYANEIGVDMIVLGLRGLTAWSAFTSAFLGSVAESVLKNSPCLTLIVKPPREA